MLWLNPVCKILWTPKWCSHTFEVGDTCERILFLTPACLEEQLSANQTSLRSNNKPTFNCRWHFILAAIAHWMAKCQILLKYPQKFHFVNETSNFTSMAAIALYIVGRAVSWCYREEMALMQCSKQGERLPYWTYLRMFGCLSLFMSCISLSIELLLERCLFILSTSTRPDALCTTWK